MPLAKPFAERGTFRNVKNEVFIVARDNGSDVVNDRDLARDGAVTPWLRLNNRHEAPR